MTSETALRAVAEMVPNWYEARTGPVDYSLRAGGVTHRFWSHRRPTPWLTAFLQVVRQDIDERIDGLSPFTTAVATDLLQEHFASKWLEIVAPGVEWRTVINYSRECLQRTYENDEIAFNLIVGEQNGQTSLADPAIQKILDPLASSNRTYFQVDRSFNFVDYRQISWDHVADPPDYVFHPEFLHPFVGLLGEQEYSVHQTQRGDLIVMNRGGLLAAKRKGRWKIYDVETLKNSITEAVGEYRVGANLFEVVFDLSFKRHGALLVYDPRELVIENVSNQESRLDIVGAADVARDLLHRPVAPINMNAIARPERKKLLFLELASIDGAIIFNNDQILAIGAMIRTHEDVPGQVGARSTAAHSAYLYGGRPIKISSDGEISILFRSTDEDGGSCDARLEFL